MIPSSNPTARPWLLALAITPLCCYSCTKDPTGPAKSGNNLIKGTVQLLNDEYGNTIADQSGSEVVLDNGVDVFKTTTTTDGSWQVANAPASVYTITASRAGFRGDVNGANDFFWNVQYVGAGTLFYGNLYLAQELSPNMISEPTASVEWTIRKDSNSHDGVRYDTTATLSIRAITKNTSTMTYIVTIADTPDADCDRALYKSEVLLRSENSVVTTTVTWTSKNSELRKALLTFVRGSTYYVQLRPRYTLRDKNTNRSTTPCIQPAVAQFTF